MAFLAFSASLFFFLAFLVAFCSLRMGEALRAHARERTHTSEGERVGRAVGVVGR